MKTTQQKIPKNTTQEITQEQKLGSLKAAENDFAKWLGGQLFLGLLMVNLNQEHDVAHKVVRLCAIHAQEEYLKSDESDSFPFFKNLKFMFRNIAMTINKISETNYLEKLVEMLNGAGEINSKSFKGYLLINLINNLCNQEFLALKLQYDAPALQYDAIEKKHFFYSQSRQEKNYINLKLVGEELSAQLAAYINFSPSTVITFSQSNQ